MRGAPWLHLSSLGIGTYLGDEDAETDAQASGGSACFHFQCLLGSSAWAVKKSCSLIIDAHAGCYGHRCKVILIIIPTCLQRILVRMQSWLASQEFYKEQSNQEMFWMQCA
jgi:hypothetical protein